MTLEGGGFRDNPNKKGRNGFRGFLFGHKMREGAACQSCQRTQRGWRRKKSCKAVRTP